MIQEQKKKMVTSDFMLTYLFPIYPLIELLGLKAFFLILFTFILGCMLFLVKNGGGGKAPVIELILMLVFYFLIAKNMTIAYSIFWIALISIYVLGYYQILRKK